jgi:hypothetical protein
MFIYYTDNHDVDEDTRTLSAHGDRWTSDRLTGVVGRAMSDNSSSLAIIVASRCRHPKLIKYYTDYHDVDEETRTIAHYGGDLVDNGGTGAGITRRNLYHSSTDFYDFVASLKNKNSLSQ